MSVVTGRAKRSPNGVDTQPNSAPQLWQNYLIEPPNWHNVVGVELPEGKDFLRKFNLGLNSVFGVLPCGYAMVDDAYGFDKVT